MQAYYQAPLPYIIVPAFIIVILLLIWIRQYLLKSIPNQEIRIGNGQTIGTREEQDDYFASLTTAQGTMAVLADGIGGFLNGRLCSTIAVNTFIRLFKEAGDLPNITKFFTRAASISNQDILRSLKGVRGGTTLVAVIISGGRLYWASVGDSAIAVFRNGEFININKKHILETQLEERYLAGEITKDELQVNPMKNRLTNHVGHEGFKNIDIGSELIQLEKKDKVILFSDGVYNSLTEIEMERILTQNLPPHDAAQEIIELINQKNLKNQDNATIVILEKGW